MLYKDGKVDLSLNSVELYIPWNDTWIDLPPLPDITDDDGTPLCKMSFTKLMNMDRSGHTNTLLLLGGENMDWNTYLEATSRSVWRLLFNKGNHSYYWTNQFDQPMGMYPQ